MAWTIGEHLVWNLAGGAGVALVAWIVGLVRRNVSHVDVFWSLGFLFAAWAGLVNGAGHLPRRALIAFLVTVWGVRLSTHILARNWGKPEDRRYRAMREKRGESFWWRSLYVVFGIQAAIQWVVNVIVVIGQGGVAPAALTWLDGLGALVFLAGVGFEAVGDLQLLRFTSDSANAGKVMDRGLWGYTRHPNYFGECLVWWGLFLVVVQLPSGWWGLIAPATMTFLLLKVSGVTMLESSMRETRPEYAAYQARVSAFVPWPPKNAA